MQEYKNDKIIVRFDPKICIHSGRCIFGLRAVFDVSRRPWVSIDGASPEAIAQQVSRCPSGALTYELLVK